MIAQSIRASRQALARVARQQPTYLARRTFITPTAVRQADFVQDLYLRELKAYKVPQVKANDAEGHVQKFTVPKAPASPEETDIASELKAYETQAVDVEGGSSAEGGAVLPEEDWFVEEDESITTPGATH
ncbi:mitochondrial F1F0 ATP synthase-like protein subunit Atp14 [Dothidotthia symphoricarpi CBS 119687]|uniref:Mitochondrial F1F0 ATP synthase-like protein subunit Atp14 n=1 Tax=Dothidotthia symphoricarpi CBS 119687 TaxID=1392245 RepID=A0A6A6ANN2_9PLEO|nr:mitochondrial F1F0 ATP synthase-like protein subunit Atp14 [Dothidotthia symphoricarpi CBS 119687]KAF2133519.1 mitochondrial F1F0 ATP synthase-like protein subunit Atp14 [Dothidotthia symphoricarpi CBS 119687]